MFYWQAKIDNIEATILNEIQHNFTYENGLYLFDWKITTEKDCLPIKYVEECDSYI